MAIRNWLEGVIDFYRRRATIELLRRLDDHRLDNIGLRKDQLDLFGLDDPARAPVEEIRGRVREKPRVRRPARWPRQPTLQGCG